MVRRLLDIRHERYRLIAARTDVFDGEIAVEHALALVSAYRRQKALAYRFEKDRRLSLLAGLLLDDLLAEHGLRERDMAYVEGKYGKPSFRDAGSYHFSLSHGGKMSVAALSQEPIGVDVERLSTFPRDIADPYEWTSMEAVGKALGTGIAGYVDQGNFAVPDGFGIEHVECDGYLICIALQL